MTIAEAIREQLVHRYVADPAILGRIREYLLRVGPVVVDGKVYSCDDRGKGVLGSPVARGDLDIEIPPRVDANGVHWGAFGESWYARELNS